MSDLVTRLSMQANAFSNLDFWSGREPSQEETAIINDLREAVDRIADLELALVELSQTSGSPRNVASAEVLASRGAMGRPPRLGAQAMSDLASRSEGALRAVMRADRQAHDKRKGDQAAIDLEATKERFPRGVHVGRTRQTTRSTKRLNVRWTADMSAKRVIIFAIAGGLAYVGLIATITTFAAYMAPV